MLLMVFSINFSKANTKVCLILQYIDDNSYLFVHGKKISKFKADDKNVNFPTQFCLGNISNVFKRKCVRFSVDYSAIDKSYILRFTKKNNQIFSD